MLFIISLSALKALMYKYQSKNCAVKLNSARKDIDTDLSVGTHTRHSSRAITGTEGTYWSSWIWCRKPLHPFIPQKYVSPWPAPYHNSNDYLCFTYDQKTSGSNYHQTRVILPVSILCYTKGPYKERELIPGAASNVKQRCIFIPVHVQKQIPTLLHLYYNIYNICYQDWVHSLSFHSLQHQRQILHQLHNRKLNRTTLFSHTEPKPKNGAKFTLTCKILTQHSS